MSVEEHGVPAMTLGAPWGAAMEHVGIGVYSWCPATEELCWDERLASMFAADRPGEAPLGTCLRRIHPDDLAQLAAIFGQVDEGELPECVFRIVLDNGTLRHLLTRTTHVVRDQGGTVVSATGVVVDVTIARESESLLASMLDSISDGFFLLDRDYRFAFVNRQGEAILHRTADDLLGRSLWDAFPDAVGTRFDAVYHRVMENRTPERFEEFYPEPLNNWFEVRAEPSGEGIVVYFTDVTEQRNRRAERERLLEAERRSRREADRARASAERAKERLAYQATHDPLTGLVNRWQFQRLGQAGIDEATAGSPVTMMFMDLDRFKLVNDSLGHAVGDALLAEIGTRLTSQLRKGDVLARQGGDEFVVLLRDASPAEAHAAAERMRSVVLEPLCVGGHNLTTTVSIGLASSSAAATVETLLRDADVALYRAKDAGRNSIAWFDAESHQRLLDRIDLESDLRQALARGELELHYQSIYAVNGARLCGVEALARWTHPQRGPVPSEVFIPVAEESGLIRSLGRHVLELSCRQAAQWTHLEDFTVWANVSGREFTPGYSESVLDLLAREGVPTHRIGIEVTESVLADEAVAVHELRLLHAAGVAVAIDDFGTGYSSLTRLARLPISVLKIDQSFVAEIETRLGRATVDVVVRLADAMGLRTVAEGVETPRQLELLREAGVDSASGYLLGRPASASLLTWASVPA
jgi:diguanylate cyclase (GGDEF)-like protein/PAS domain S-box-containing protein